MYESPITLINGELQLSLENGVYKAVRQTGVVVDKDELIKALKYDRGQYEKGYADAKAEQKRGKWVNRYRAKWDRTLYWFRACSECDFERDDCNSEKDTMYCPNCGAKMEDEE